VKTSTRIAAALSAAALGVGLTACAADQGGTSADGSFAPSGDASMIVPFSAGGGSDASGRAIAAGLEAATGTNVVVENREGGSGAVGYSYLLSQEGDDQTLLAAETSLSSIPLSQDVDFTATSFTPVAKIGEDATLLVVPASSPFQTCSDVTTAAGAGSVVVAVSGAVSLDEVVFRLIETETGVTFDRVPYESGGEVLTGLLGGQVQVASLNPGEVVGQLESGDLRALCAVAEERYTDYPELADIPTATEQGIDVAFTQWRGFIGAGGMSPEARTYWADAAEAWTQTPEYEEYISSNYMQPVTAYGEELDAYLAEYDAQLATAIGR